jgi:hypothetical protein
MKKLWLEFAAWCVVVCAFALVIVACPPSPVVPTPDADAVAPPPVVWMDAAVVMVDASPSTPEGAACNAMAVVGCREGKMVDCAATIRKINADPHFVHSDVKKLSAAKTADDVRAAGTSCTL